MLKFIIFISIFLISLSAKEHYAKVEPYEMITVASNVSGEVIFTDEMREGKIVTDKAYLLVDSELDLLELKRTTQNIKSLENTLKIDEDILKNYALISQKKEINYDRIKDLKIKSTVEKDREQYDLLSSENQYLSLQKEMENIKLQINDLNFRKAQLDKSIKDKKKSADGYMLYELLVKKGEYLSPSTPVAKIADISKAKLILYLNKDEIDEIENSKIFIDGRETNNSFSKIYNIADSKHLSSYKVEIIIDPPKTFSNLLKVEFKK